MIDRYWIDNQIDRLKSLPKRQVILASVAGVLLLVSVVLLVRWFSGSQRITPDRAAWDANQRSVQKARKDQATREPAPEVKGHGRKLYVEDAGGG